MIYVAELADLSAALAATRARSKKIQLLSDFLKRATPEELPIAVKFLIAELRQGKIGLGAAAVRAALAKVQTPSDTAPAVNLTIRQLDDVFTEIAAMKGSGSQARRNQRLQDALANAPSAVQNFVAGLMLGELRHGASEGMMVEAVARAMNLAADEVRRAVMLTGDLATVVQLASSSGSNGLRAISCVLFRPIQPMLAETADDVEMALGRLGEAAWEFKLDGVRVQVHKQGDLVQVFTRNLKEVTHLVPELVEQTRQLRIEQAILDGELLALRSDGRPHPFQTTMRRFGRTGDVAEIRSSLPLSGLFFDCLLIDRQPLIDLPTRDRYAALSDCVPEHLRIPRQVTGDVAKASEFLEMAIGAGHEGLMAKSLDAPYVAGGRGQHWLKIKPAQTLDLVILAAEWGSGRRRGWLSNLHLGARDTHSGEFAMVGKTFKGLTDEMLTWQTQRLLSLEVAREDFTVYVRPVIVAEIAFHEVQRSPHYDSGFALRFARVRRFRTDKSSEQVDTLDTLTRLFQQHRR